MVSNLADNGVLNLTHANYYQRHKSSINNLLPKIIMQRTVTQSIEIYTYTYIQSIDNCPQFVP